VIHWYFLGGLSRRESFEEHLIAFAPSKLRSHLHPTISISNSSSLYDRIAWSYHTSISYHSYHLQQHQINDFKASFISLHQLRFIEIQIHSILSWNFPSAIFYHRTWYRWNRRHSKIRPGSLRNHVIRCHFSHAIFSDKSLCSAFLWISILTNSSIPCLSYRFLKSPKIQSQSLQSCLLLLIYISNAL
jgi:hypothetical protein